MNRFVSLLKKELKELLTPQMLIPMLIGVVFFMFIGNIAGNETKKATSTQNVSILDLDTTTTSKNLIDSLTKSGYKIDVYTNSSIDKVIDDAKSKKIKTVLTIPKGFEKGLSEFKPQQVDTYSIVTNFSFIGSMSTKALTGTLEQMNELMSNDLITRKAPGMDPTALKKPISTTDHVVVGNKTGNATADQIMAFIMSQTLFIPMIMFFIIMFSAQMIAVSIASEKENKTLETLLSTPIKRTHLVTAKMLAAGIVSLIIAVVYMFGFKYYMNGLTGNALQGAESGTSDVLNQLGLVMDTKGYVLLGISLFLSILIALCMSIIVGAFAEDVKKVQGFIMPMVLLIMIPFIITMFVDINSASLLLKIIIYAIPFSHPFLASPNLYLHNDMMVVYGIIYELVVFLVFVYIAGRIFSTDKILTMKLKLGKKSFLKMGK